MKLGDYVRGSCRVFDLHQAWQDYQRLYKEGPPPGISTGWAGFDEYFKILRGQLNVLSGVPSSGKSEWIEGMAINLAKSNNFKVFMYSPENYPVQFHLMKLAEKYVQKPFFSRYGETPMNQQEMDTAFDFICQHFTIIDAAEHPYDLRRILFSIEKAETLYGRKFDMVIIDPWNEVEDFRAPGKSETEFIGKALSQCRRLARRRNLSFWIVAHPTKLQVDKMGKIREPSLYDIHGSAHWRNKTDNGILLHRTDEQLIGGSAFVKAKIAKIKNRFYGKFGEHYFKFQLWNSVFVDTAAPKDEDLAF